jgi:hypothetical protein
MKNILLFSVLVFSIYTPVLCGSPGDWDIGGKVSAVKSHGDFGVKTGFKCEYHCLSIISWRTDLEAFAHGDGLSRVDMAIPSNLLWYPLHQDATVAPYIGPGLTYNHDWNNKNTLGINTLAGVNFSFIAGRIFGIECKYTVPLLPDVKPGHFEIGLTDSWEMNF